MPLIAELPIVEEAIPSEANFILARFYNARKVFEYLISKKVIVRDRSNQPLCDDCLRLTIGTRDENDELLRELRAFA